MKAHGYIDGFNLYWGMMDASYNFPGAKTRPALREYLWLDLNKFLLNFLPKGCPLDQIHYFTAPVRDNPSALARQQAFWKALESHDHLNIHLGVNARRYGKAGNVIRYEEKQSDVRFALQSIEDALLEGQPTHMVMLCADADQYPTIERIQALRSKIEIILVFPPCRHSDDLAKLIPHPHKTGYEILRDSQFPDHVEYIRGGQIVSADKPNEWK